MLSPPSLVATLPRRGRHPDMHHSDTELADRLLQRRVKARLFGDLDEAPPRIGAYRLDRRLGAGGMGVVYQAYDPALERPVAIKVMHAELRGAAEQIRREARALARLAHPNVVSVHEIGEHDGQLFVAMEYVDGETLGAWLARHPVRPPPAWRRALPGLAAVDRGGPDFRPVLERFIEAARGLQAVHAAGLIHRDFKPDNVLVGRDGRVRVADFGIASTLDAATAELEITADIASPLHTRAGELAGTPAYMAPEQFAGEPVDARADQFALCVALYEAVCGARPFAGCCVADLRTSILAGAARPAPRWLPAPLSALLARGLQRDPARRFPDMAALAAALERLLRPRVGRWAVTAALTAAVVTATLANAGITSSNGHAHEDMPSETGSTLVERLWFAAPAVCIPRLPFTGDKDALTAANTAARERMKAHPTDSAPYLDAKIEAIALLLRAGQTSACKLASATRTSPLDQRQAHALACLERQFCAPLATAAPCPEGMRNDGPDGCEPVATCDVTGTEAQGRACLAGEADCCKHALIVGEYMDLEAGIAGTPESKGRRRALAEAGCARGYAWLCVEAAALDPSDSKVMRDRACSLGYAQACAEVGP
ncbi:serine/threonine-protein kinase [Nannocystis radixulma]|uniref:Serine/threonine-protein kinase n=1 Tax=Nannocystis radixulma TaxID=2995305 RepID=A0ABT5BAG4_9BACT|nr:serine/threonine-protein kinase [Nannocystis radixulma]MDC0670027.1 serine/threonine-protein kinase [Nannocystis radixulma]